MIDSRGRALTPCRRKVAEREVRLQRAKWVGRNKIRLRFDPFEARYIRLKVLARDHYRCHWCGQTGDTIDHIIPWSKGGRTNLINCVTACQVCNNQRGDLPAEEFARQKGVEVPVLTGNEPIPKVLLRRGLTPKRDSQPEAPQGHKVVELNPQARAVVARALEEELEVPSKPADAPAGDRSGRKRRRNRRRGGKQAAPATPAQNVAAAASDPAEPVSAPLTAEQRAVRVLLISRLLEGNGSPLNRRQFL